MPAWTLWESVLLLLPAVAGKRRRSLKPLLRSYTGPLVEILLAYGVPLKVGIVSLFLASSSADDRGFLRFKGPKASNCKPIKPISLNPELPRALTRNPKQETLKVLNPKPKQSPELQSPRTPYHGALDQRPKA